MEFKLKAKTLLGNNEFEQYKDLFEALPESSFDIYLYFIAAGISVKDSFTALDNFNRLTRNASASQRAFVSKGILQMYQLHQENFEEAYNVLRNAVRVK